MISGLAPARISPALVLALLTAACAARDTIAVTGGGEDLDTYCAGTGPPVLVGGACTGELAEAVFRHAVCACGALSVVAELVTDGFDSRIAPHAPGGAGGHVGSNAGFTANAIADLRGDLTVAGVEGVAAGPRLDVAGDLAVAAGLGRPSSAIGVGGAAQVGGAIEVASLDVAGALVTAPGAPASGAITAGSRPVAAVDVPPPCRCDGVLDIAAVIAEHALVNHDAELGLSPGALRDVSGDATLELPCGRFYLDEILGTGPGAVTIRATGRTAVFVAGNVTLRQDLVVEVAPGAELDLFVAGTIQVAGALRLGDPARPRALRLYVASGGSLSLSGGAQIAANVFAPAADLAVSAPIELYGALVVHRLVANAPVALHHDRAVAAAGETCLR